MSTIQETIATLKEYNKWRRGDETITMPDPFELGVAIDDAVRLLKELEHIKSEFEKIALLCARKADSNVELRLRAEKAEAKLHALTLICGTSDANKFQSWVDKERERADKAEDECLEQARLLGISGSREASLIARAEKAEAELAKAREKVRVLRDALERRHTEQGYHRQYVDDILAATEEASK
jgi:hypothetical protein